MINVDLCNGLTLAYMGDSVFELEIRKRLVLGGITKSNLLHKKAILYTCASAQASFIRYLINENKLSDEEISIYKRGRNSHVNLTRKNINLAEYLDATGFEALIGYLYLKNEITRITDLVDCVYKLI